MHTTLLEANAQMA